MEVRMSLDEDGRELVGLIAQFRVTLAQLRGRTPLPDLDAACAELADYVSRGYPIFVAKDDVSGVVAYLVCRVDGDVVWAESLFVSPEYRRRGIASELYAEVEHLADGLGGVPYNWVHPNNDAIIQFLKNRGYTVLNLVELRRARPGEELADSVRVGEHEFDY